MVLKRLSKALRPTSSRPSLPDGERVYAIGDIHGRSDLLGDLLGQIQADDRQRDPARTTIICLGDLVDRGPDSAGVIDRLIALRTAGASVRALWGNHDEVFAKAFAGDTKALRFLCRIGGKETILSYGIDKDEYERADFDTLGRLLDERLPAEHRAFFDTLEDHVELGDYLFVHAGIRPQVPLAEQKASDLRWIRDDFLSHRGSHPHIVVHGHSISAAAELRSNRIGIDTGAFASGKLTALGLQGMERWLLTAEGAPEPRWGVLSD